jgi:hypothetical protein
MLSYCARLCAIASGETSSAATAASQANFGANFGKLFIKQSLGEWRVSDLRSRLVPLPGEDVAKSRRHRGEMYAAHALTNAVRVTLTLCVQCIASVDACVMRTRKIVVQMTQSRCNEGAATKPIHSTANLSHSTIIAKTRRQYDVRSLGRCAMARLDSSYLPRGNPCAQCGKPIPRPDWVESSQGRTSFLWFCRACDYRFEAIAIYEEADPDALAA